MMKLMMAGWTEEKERAGDEGTDLFSRRARVFAMFWEDMMESMMEKG